ncbi:MAG TPA: methyltransferase domain-containing protein [Desulfobacteraceae bacterium]|nr:methyltransferase domain-containing protein [Desulfobacteraceae bacterium]
MNRDKKSVVLLGPGERVDRFLDGRLSLIQSKTGYRFSIDALLLADFATIKEGDLLVDLGTGCGVIALILLFSRPVKKVWGLEIQDELSRQAARNVEMNGCSARMAVVRGDITRVPFRQCSIDVVICNPPYRKPRSGRVNPDPERAIARHEILTGLGGIVRAASFLLKPKGRFAIIYPAERLVDLFAHLRRFNLEPKRLKVVYPSVRAGAKLALVEATMGGRPGLKVEAPGFA